VVYLLGLLSRLSSGEMERLSERLCLHRKARECLQVVRRCQGEVLKSLSISQRPANSLLYRLLHHLPDEALVYLLAAAGNRASSRRVVHYRAHLRDVRLDIGGDDLQKMGLAPGAEYRRILDRVLMAKLDGQVRGRAGELRLAGQLAGRGAHRLHKR
jgi:tRNA nucleotidyltransferase (CCA-adding enzyme)